MLLECPNIHINLRILSNLFWRVVHKIECYNSWVPLCHILFVNLDLLNRSYTKLLFWLYLESLYTFFNKMSLESLPKLEIKCQGTMWEIDWKDLSLTAASISNWNIVIISSFYSFFYSIILNFIFVTTYLDFD